jgi:glycosyltransferase involved in cell wall biosynthesis
VKARRVLHVDPERGFSGGETQVLALALDQHERGHEVVVAAHPDGELARRARDAGLGHVPLVCRYGHDPVAGMALRREVLARAPDVVHLHTSRALSLGPWLPRRAVQVVTRRMDYAPRGLGPYVRWLYGRMDAVIAISQAARAALAARGIAVGAVDVVPSGVDTSRFHGLDARAARAQLGIDDGVPVIAIVASLHERKGHAVLLEALAEFVREEGEGGEAARPLLLAAGTGPEGEALQDLAARLGLGRQVRWLGRVADVRPVLAAADVVVMPSLAEGLGVAAIEAMAAARPLVASAVGGLPELVRDGEQGLLVPPRDASALASALRRCLRDPELRTRLGAAGQLRAEAFSTAAMARGTESVYERALAARSARRRR